MSKIKIIVVGLIVAILIAVIVPLMLIKDVRAGLAQTIGVTVKDTLALVGIGDKDPPTQVPIETPTNTVDQPTTETPTSETPNDSQVVEEKPRGEDNLLIHIPNTEGDFIVIVEGKNALVLNGGLNEDDAKIQAYLKKIGIKKARYMISTNYLPSSVQGVPKLLSYLPSDYVIIAENVASQELDKNVVNYLKKNQMIWTTPQDNGVFQLGKSTFKLLRTHAKGSVVVVLTNGKTKMVFSGTSTKFDDSLINKLPVDVDLYSVTATSSNYVIPQKVFERLNPKNVTINDNKGVDNSKSLKLLEGKQLVPHITTKKGNLIIGSNGEDIIVNPEKQTEKK